MIESTENRRSLYFKISVALFVLAVVPYNILRDYYISGSENSLESGINLPLLNLLTFPDIAPLLFLFAVIAAILVKWMGVRAKVVWLGVLSEFLYILLNIFISNVSGIEYPTRFDPFIIAGIGLFVCSIAFSTASLGVERVHFDRAKVVMIRLTAVFFILSIFLLIGAMMPVGLRTMLRMPTINWVFPLLEIKLPIFSIVLMVLSKTLPIILIAFGIAALIGKWRYGYLYVSLILVFFALRWIEMILPVVQTSWYFHEAFAAYSSEFTCGLLYRIVDGFARYYLPLVVAVMSVPALISFMLGLYFLFHIKEKAPDAS
jgi:hypothetical protein